MGPQRRCAQGVFAEDQALLGNLVSQIVVLPRVDPVQPRAHHRHGGHRVWWCMAQNGAEQRALVRRAVDAQRQPRDNGQATRTQAAGKVTGIDLPLWGGVAAAHDGDGVCGLQLGQRVRLAQDIEHQGRVCHVQQSRRVVGVCQSHHTTLNAHAWRFLQPSPSAVV